MSSDSNRQGRPSQEAASWFARLNATSISTAELLAFRTWRREPANDAAYRTVEQVWRQGGAVANDHDVREALAGARARNKPRAAEWLNHRLTWAIGLGGVVAVSAIAAAVGLTLRGPIGSVYETAVGERSTIALEDGSTVQLDTGSRIVVRFTRAARAVTLVTGQALFEVAHRPDRPFEVSAGDTRIRDLGTRFDVRRDQSQVRITVLQGLVQVASNAREQAVKLPAGLQMATGMAAESPHPIDLTKTTSWTSGQLMFEDVPLSAASAEINRYTQHKLILQSAAVGQERVNGVFDSNDPQAFVAAVSRLYDLKVSPQSDGSIVLTANP